MRLWMKQPKTAAPMAPGLSMVKTAALAGLPSCLPSSTADCPSDAPTAAPAAPTRTWWFHGSLLMKRTRAPTATTVTVGTNCCFSWFTTALLSSGVLGWPLPLGVTITTASGVGLPSRSSTSTSSVPAAAPLAARAHAAQVAAMLTVKRMVWCSLGVNHVAVHGRQAGQQLVLRGKRDVARVHGHLQHLHHRVEVALVDFHARMGGLHV